MAAPSPDPEPPISAGAEPPRKAESSLPSYSQPPLREHKNRQLDREEVAERDLKGTRFGPGARTLLIAAFLLTITAPAFVQLAVELRAGKGLPTFNVIKALPKWSKVRAARNPADFWNLAPRADDIKDFEKGMEKDSVIAQWLLPHVQNVLTGTLGAGNEQAYPGRPGWLFYRPDVEYAIGPPFLDPTLLGKRGRSAGVKPDPLPAILDFRDQLQARGIELVVFPVPVKPVIEGEKLSTGARAGEALQNPSFEEFKARLAQAGVRVFDPTALLMARKKEGDGAPLYLETDTHWRPETMKFVAWKLADFLGRRGPTIDAGGRSHFSTADAPMASLGDIALMLKLPDDQTLYRPQTVTTQQVSTGTAPWRATRDADTLLLGDSFSNIFSLPGMGWGESAGFAEHLSRALDKPIDTILRNSDASYATRDILSKELARGRDRLAGKKLVVWELAARELAMGNWKLLRMKLGKPAATHFFGPKTGETYTVTGTVNSLSPVPLPGSVPYKDHLLTVHLTDIALEGQPQGAVSGDLQALVYLWSMRDNVWTPAARLRAGDQVKLRLRAWSDVSGEYEKINRSEIDDPAFQLEEPVWGELVK